MAANPDYEDNQGEDKIEDIPEDFTEQIAGRIIVLHEKEMDPAISSANIAAFIYEYTNNPKLLRYFIEATEVLLEEDSNSRFAALAWASLVAHSDTVPNYMKYVVSLASYQLEGYYNMAKPEVALEKKKFSGYAHFFGILFIRMIEMNGSLYETIQEIYSAIVRLEMELEANEQAEKKDDKKSLLLRKGPKKKTISKKLYDDIVDYLSTRGDFKSSSLNQENPNEHIAILADRLRGTRRYVMQDIMNKRALERKKRLEKELSERLASAEEVILAGEPFRQGLSLFWREKRYNYKFLAVEKIRVALQIIGILIGLFYFMAGYLALWQIHWIDGILICLGMWSFVKFMGARKQFKSFYPYDVSKELEICVNDYTAIMRRMSKEQMKNFLVRQIKDKNNESILQIIPEFVKYLYAVMPDRKNMVLTVEQLSDLMEGIEVEIAKFLRSRV